MTSTPDTTEIAAEHGRLASLSLWGKVHADTRHAWRIASRLFPVMEKIALNPALDQLFEEALAAADAGVAAEVFQAATDCIQLARLRRQAGKDPAPNTAPAAAAQPVQDASTDGTM